MFRIKKSSIVVVLQHNIDLLKPLFSCYFSHFSCSFLSDFAIGSVHFCNIIKSKITQEMFMQIYMNHISEGLVL